MTHDSSNETPDSLLDTLLFGHPIHRSRHSKMLGTDDSGFTPEQAIFTIHDVVKQSGLSRSMVTHHKNAGHLTFTKIKGRLLFTQPWIDEFKQFRKLITGTPDNGSRNRPQTCPVCKKKQAASHFHVYCKPGGHKFRRLVCKTCMPEHSIYINTTQCARCQQPTQKTSLYDGGLCNRCYKSQPMISAPTPVMQFETYLQQALTI